MSAATHSFLQEDCLFQAVITPHLSLSRRGALLVIAALAGLNAVTSGACLLLGAWPVVGFLGLDVAAVALAFLLCRRAANRREELLLTRAVLLIRDVPVSGPVRETRLDPYWTRLKRHLLDDEGMVALDLTSHGRSHRIASALSPSERAEFADALERALKRVRSHDH